MAGGHEDENIISFLIVYIDIRCKLLASTIASLIKINLWNITYIFRTIEL